MSANNLVRALRKMLLPPVVDVQRDGVMFSYYRDDYKPDEKIRTAPPARIKETRITSSFSGLVDYVNRFKRTHTTIFVDPPKKAAADAELYAEAIIDYHEAHDQPLHLKAGCAMHRIYLRLQVHSAASAWLAAFNRPLTHIEFGELVEEYGWAVDEPDQVTLDLIGVSNFSSSRSVEFRQVDSLPKRIKLRPPVFAVDHVKWPALECRLRKSVKKDGEFAISVKPLLLQEWMQNACDLVRARLQEATDCHVYIAQVLPIGLYFDR